MICNICESGFKETQSVVVHIEKSGNSALLYIRNQGRNIIHIRRIILCRTAAGEGTIYLYLRPSPESLPWVYPSAFLEPGATALFFKAENLPPGSIVQAQAEYMEIESRSRSSSVII